MELKKTASAGTLESSDIQIIVDLDKKGIDLQLESVVMDQFGESIRKIILETLKELKISDAYIVANDRGAIDSVIKSRVQTAVMRAAGKKTFEWQ